MASTRRTRGRPPAEDEPLAMLPPPKKRSKPRAGKKRRVIDLMSDDETSSLKQEDPDVNEQELENLQIASIPVMETHSGDVKVEMGEGSRTNIKAEEGKITVDVDDHVEAGMLHEDVDSSMQDVNNGGGSISQEESPQPRERRPGRKNIYEVRHGNRRHLFPKLIERDFSREVSEETAVEQPIPEKKSPKRATVQTLIPDDIIDDDSDWDEEFLMTDPNSIYGANLRQLFNPVAWDRIPDEDKEYLMKHLPECDKVYEASEDVTDPTPPKPKLVDGFWENSQLIARINQVEYDISEGKYTPTTQKAVEAARKLAQTVEFDNFKENKFEAFWGQKQRVDSNAVAGDTSNVKLETLAKHSALRVGDVFSLRRSFASQVSKKGKKTVSVTIEKDAKLIAIDPEDFSLTFSYPPGKLQVSVDGKPDKVISGVLSITALETRLCREDGRAPAKLPNGNAFKTFRIKRNEQDIGSLFDVRMEFHSKYLSPGA